MVSTGGEYYLGLDIGSLSTKCVVIDAEREIVQTHVTATGCSPGRTGRAVYDDLLARAGIRDGLRGVVATGYGRVSIDFASKRFTEIACHARGAHHHNPCVRTVVDIGGQDSKVIKLNEGGDVIDFCMNDKCAAGTGKFLEIMAKTLTVDLVDLGPVAAASRAPCALSSTCSVFAESEVVSLLAEGASREDILAGVCRSVARRVGNMAVRMGLDGDVVFVGGVSKNVGVRRELQEFLGIEFFELPGDPQLNGALGAALLAKEADHGNQ